MNSSGNATTYYSPSGNPEVWEERPKGYFTTEEWQAAHPAQEAPAPTVPELFISLRAERDRRIAATDYLVMPDYPLTEEDKATVSTYRQALRDLPQQAGAPWDGGGDLTPWPPAVKIIRSE